MKIPCFIYEILSASQTPSNSKNLNKTFQFTFTFNVKEVIAQTSIYSKHKNPLFKLNYQEVDMQHITGRNLIQEN